MTFVVVIRKEGDTTLGTIHRGDDLPSLLSRLGRAYKPRRLARWYGRRTDEFIKRHYNAEMSAQQIADALTAKRKRPITKNMVIRRAHDLGVAARRSR